LFCTHIIKVLGRERESGRKYSRKVDKVKNSGKRYFIVREEKEQILLEGSQASPVRPADRRSVKMKTF
jgi:hypothetical protein